MTLKSLSLMKPEVYTFDDAQGRVVIREPRLPSPWINYLSNGTLHAFVSQAAGGMLWWRSPLRNRITRYRQYNLPLDSPGFYLFIREADGAVWSPGWRPAETPLDAWRAEHEPGLTRFAGAKGGLEVTVELFIPPGENVLVWDVTLENRTDAPRAVSVFAYTELSLQDWQQDTQWACYVKHNLAAWRDAASGALVYLYRHFHFNPRLAECPLAWFAAGGEAADYACDRDAFIGPYRTERLPLGVERGDCGNSETLCGDPCFALRAPVALPPGGRERVPFFLGCEPRAIVEWPRALEAARDSVARMRQPGRVDELRGALRAWWREHLDRFAARLPEADLQRQIVLWTPAQCVHTGRYSRSVSQHASGVRTMGYRDTCQDMLSIAWRKPEWAEEVFRYLVSQQYEDGHAPHQCNPAEGLPAEPRVHIDNALWLPLLADAIVAETGSAALLEERLPWLSAKDNLSPAGGAPVWEHLTRMSDFIEANLGAHGLPLIHHGDWNDSIGKFGRGGRGESVMAAMQYVYALRLLEELAEFAGRGAAGLRARREKMTAALLEHAWDGRWWRRGFDDAGRPFGSAECEHGKIWLNAQTWAVIAGVGTREQQVSAMDAVAELLDTGVCGIRKLAPSYPSFPEAADPYSGYSPGCGENGAIFCHANTWAVIAEALLGRAEKAWHYFSQLVPHRALQRVGLERYQAEPYAWVSNIVGPENPKFGWANVAQVTGTATWMDVAATQYLLGIRARPGGLLIRPVVPAGWEAFEAERVFRGCRVRIAFRARAAADEAAGVRVEGEFFPDGLVPAEKLRGRREIEAVCVFERRGGS